MGCFPYDGAMNDRVIFNIAVPGRFPEGLDYLPPAVSSEQAWLPGMRFRVPLGRRALVGVLLAIKDSTDVPIEKLRCAEECLDTAPVVSNDLLRLLQWVSDYYQHPIGEVIMTALPKGLRLGKASAVPDVEKIEPKLSLEHTLTDEQRDAVSRITDANKFQVFLLDGVTGSGKTEVYMQAAEAVLQRGQQVLVLVPEIGLTPQMMHRFEQRFNVPVLAMHSAVADGKRLKHWQSVKAAVPLIVVGTRLSVFAPFSRLGLVVVDEEHDLSFKQQSGLRYSARDVAIKRCADLQVPIVLGSATPSFESLHNVERRGYQHLLLRQRATQSVMPAIQLIDVRRQKLHGGLTEQVISAIRRHLQQGQQVLLFLNRRGFAPVLLCHHCGWTVECDACDALMVWHKQAQRLRCHHCSRQMKNPTICQQCQQSEIEPIGFGTQRLDEVLTELFPGVPVLRVDRDSTQKKSSLQDMVRQIESAEPMILVGTQMLAKGHHFPDLSLVVMVDADSGLFSVDFRAQERLAQQIVQVAGRAGRAQHAGEVLLQTHHPEHALLQQLLSLGYDGYAAAALQERQQIQLPPYRFWALLHAEAKRESEALSLIQQCVDSVAIDSTQVELMGPVIAPMARRQGYYRAQLVLSSVRREVLNGLLSLLSKKLVASSLSARVRWAIDVDPLELG